MVRVIPRLDIKGPNLVKGIHLEGLKILGPPDFYARAYYEGGADELLYMDAVASLYGRNSLLDIVRQTASEIFIPLTVGGGLRTLDDISTVLRAGADKVAINSAAIHDPSFITAASRKFGSSTICLQIDAVWNADRGYTAYVDNGRDNAGLDVVSWARRGVELGAGEIVLTSIDREGTGLGYDLELIGSVAAAVDVPLIACGGGGSVADVVRAAGKADAVGVASLLHYHMVERLMNEGVMLGSGGDFAVIEDRLAHAAVKPASLAEIKAGLSVQGIPCRAVQTTEAR